MNAPVLIEIEIKGEHLAGLRELTNEWWDRNSTEKSALEVEAQTLLNLAIWKGVKQLRAIKNERAL